MTRSVFLRVILASARDHRECVCVCGNDEKMDESILLPEGSRLSRAFIKYQLCILCNSPATIREQAHLYCFIDKYYFDL